MPLLLLIGGSLGAILLYLLATASANTSLMSDYYWELLALNGAFATGLIGVIGVQLWQLRQRLRERVFGAKLTFRLVIMFALVTVVPGAVVYTVSVQFLTKSIETWFDVRVDTALERGLNLGRSAFDYLLLELEEKSSAIAFELGGAGRGELVQKLITLRTQMGVADISVYDNRGAVITDVRDKILLAAPIQPNSSEIRQLKQQRAIKALINVPEYGLTLRVLVPINSLLNPQDVRILQILQPVPPRLAEDAELVENMRAEYRQLALSREGLKRIYSLTLTVALLLALLAALAVAVLLSNRLAAPLAILAAGTRAVAQGDFSQRQPVYSRDELGILTHSFNRMTRQLAETREMVERNQLQLEASKIYLESILNNLSSGVLAFDADGHLRSVNQAAARILGIPFEPLRPLALPWWADTFPALAPLCQAIEHGFATHRGSTWSQPCEYAGEQQPQNLLLHGARLPGASDSGYVVVIDDITALLKAQRDAAWGEVAKRLAHEIRNPLTPIQLSAERLAHKLAHKLDPADADMLVRATNTIVTQVAALASMVDAFKEYARAPATQLSRLDLHYLLYEVLALYEGARERIVLDFTPEPLWMDGDATLLRQLVHNLIKNAQEALVDTAEPTLRLITRHHGQRLRLSLQDNGSGFDDTMLANAFEPYATSKPKGTGLGLAIVKKIIEEHHGIIRLKNLPDGGACIDIDLPLAPASAATDAQA
jgi:nitrogen fixation/metabolism regulation signal transduction histidine kinase